ncbi:MAG: hypothetical protein ACREIC_33560 [Limisphaerales bacterium]
MSGQNNMSSDILQVPAHPYSGQALWEKVRRAVAEERGYKMTLERVAGIVGKQTSTAEHWLSLSEQPHVRGFVCLLERLSEEERARVMREVCRTFPTITHPRLAHAPAAVEAMLALLRQRRGLTIIRGGGGASSFLITAMGHTYPQLERRHRMATGLDIHQPDRIVPVESVVYLRSPLKREQLIQAVHQVWPDIRASHSQLMLFNGVWSLFPEYHEDILGWARERHVIIADSAPPPHRPIFRQGVNPVNVLTVSHLQENSGRIQVICQHFGR